MSTFSQQTPYSIILDDISLSADISYNTTATNTISISSLDTITIGSNGTSNDLFYDTSQYELNFGKEWHTHFPDFYQIENMCKEYPALEKALENFKTIYEMVKDDYANKTRNEDQ